MRDSAFFRRDIRDSSSKLGWEAGIKITSGSGISGFHGAGIRGIRKGNRVGYGISIPLSSRASETLEFAPPFFSRTLLSRQA